ncbi:MAG: HD domain-containing protein [Methanosarcinaceae archaeon]|nr:HD domain-containing protein [Methanosarcinaceae archaeon]
MSLNISSAKAVLPEKKIVPRPLSIEALFHKYGIERSHADNVARNALEFFDLLAPVHGLANNKYRKLMETAALVHDIGVSTDLEKHHLVGRDILFRHPPSELSEQLRPVVAWTTYLHKKKAGKKKLEKLRKTSFAELPEDLQVLTLKIASLLRLADALDYSRMESRLGNTRFGKGVIEFDIIGAGAEIDVERLYKKGDLWALLFESELEFRPEGPE